MKRYLILAIVLCGLVLSVQATSLNFQDAGDNVSVTAVGAGTSGTYYWVNSTTGGNSYTFIDAWYSIYVKNAVPNMMTYSAATLASYSFVPGYGYGYIILLDSSGTTLWSTSIGNSGDIGSAPKRFEVQLTGGVARVYRDGTLVATSGTLSQNPSYIGYGAGGYVAAFHGQANWDDFVWGDTENKNVTGNPQTEVYIIRNDLINPASSGLAYAANGSIINSNNFTSTFSRSNITYLGNQTIELKNSDTGFVYGRRYTGYASTGTVSWAIQDELITAGAPNGFYHVTIADSNVNSEQIQYTANGATLTLDRANYSVGDTATASGEVQLGGYWDTSTYSYKVAFRDAYGNYVHNSSALTSRIFSEAYTFDDADTQGAYYAILMATPLAGGPDYWLALDHCQLTAYLNFDGYVNDETGSVISGAVVNITQDALVVNYTTGADGAYVANNFITGSQIIFNVTATGYQQYYKTTTPLSATSTSLNFTLPSDTKTYYGLAIGGVAREGILTGIDITDGLGKPIEGATVVLKNTTNGNYHTNLTNVAGWYLADEGSSIVLISKRPYDVWSMKTGYSNSANYTVVAP